MIHNDHLGTPQKMTDGTGAVVWAADYKPFGEATITISTITNNLRFPGQYYDAETGLHYNYFRDYNPVIARYIESDPLGIQASKNHLYIYTANNPYVRTDPLGLFYNPFSLNEDYIVRGPSSCPRCFEPKIVERIYGFASLSADPTGSFRRPSYFYSASQRYVTIVTLECKPTCCRESGPAVTHYGNGPLTSQNWLVRNLYTFTWTSETYQFDCSACMTSCGCH